jgi:predicted nucleic-acid-binding protein
VNAVDTNVLARFFIDDGDDQEAARQRPAAIVALSQRAYVSATVLLEFEWVMRGFYAFPRAEIIRVLRALASFEQVSIEDRSAVLEAFDFFEGGLDFADSLHLARAQRASRFLTFDRQFARRASRLSASIPVDCLD